MKRASTSDHIVHPEANTSLTTEKRPDNFTVHTTATGCPIGYMKHSQTVGQLGPMLLQDHEMLEKVMHFDREKTPPRNVHALGTGCHGHFVATNNKIGQYTCASLFQAGKKTPIFVRFSGVFTEVGDPDVTRDPRGFAIKFYTDQGNWDLLAINTPVFNVRDIKMGPDAVHAFKRDPRTGMWNSEQVWDFVVTHPESLHQTLMIFSDRDGTPMSYRYMNAYACNTFSFLNEKKERFWVKFHLVSNQGARGLSLTEAKIIAGEDPNFLARDLHEALNTGRFPTWKLAFQIMQEKDGYKHPFTFDCTKIWNHKQFPLIDLGIVTVDRNPTDYHAEVEQVAFSPANVVPGISYSPDRLLQGRLFLYDDTQFHRLGPNFKQIPINRPHCPMLTNYVGGSHQMEVKNKYPHYTPSTLGGLTVAQTYVEPPLMATGAPGIYNLPEEGTPGDYYDQARDFLTIMDPKDQANLAHNIAFSLTKVPDELAAKVVHHLQNISKDLANRVFTERKDITTGKIFTENEKLYLDMCEKLRTDVFVKKH